MERKIGEIFEYKGEWYQCISDTTDDNCNNCFFQKKCSNITGDCSSTSRSDGKSVAFKKLKKVGEPYEYYVPKKGIIQVQDYLLADPNHTVYNKIEGVYDYLDDKVVIEIKQTKEDMEENKLNLKPFDIQKAREGKPVYTRNGRKARIICFDKQEGLPIVALIETKKNGRVSEEIASFYINGHAISADTDSKHDLMMLPEKKEGWMNIYSNGYNHKVGALIYNSKEEALNNKESNAIDTVKIEWRE